MEDKKPLKKTLKKAQLTKEKVEQNKKKDLVSKEEKTPLMAKSPKVSGRDRAYARNARLVPLAFQVLKKALKSPNEYIRATTAKQIIDKVLPDVKATEVTGANGEAFSLNIVIGNGFKPQAIDGEIVDTVIPSNHTDGSMVKPLQDAIIAPLNQGEDIVAHPRIKDALPVVGEARPSLSTDVADGTPST